MLEDRGQTPLFLNARTNNFNSTVGIGGGSAAGGGGRSGASGGGGVKGRGVGG